MIVGLGASRRRGIRLAAFACVLVSFTWFQLQDSLLPLAYHAYHSEIWRAGLVAKEFFLFAALILLVWADWSGHALRLTTTGLLAGGFIGLALLYLIVGNDSLPLAVQLVGLRGILTPILAVTVGRMLKPSFPELRILVRILLLIALASIVFGLIDLALHHATWTSTLDYGTYLTDVKGAENGFRPDVFLPWNFWWKAPSGIYVDRMAGLVGSPLGMGYYLLFPYLLVLSLSMSGIRRIGRLHTTWMVPLLLLAIALTITRAAIIAAGLGSLVLVVQRTRLTVKGLRRRVLIICSLALVLGALFLALGPLAREVAGDSLQL